jgi:hypothetical protein
MMGPKREQKKIEDQNAHESDPNLVFSRREPYGQFS